MKKLWTIVGLLVVVALIGSVFATAVLAQGPSGAPRANFVDEDGDGVCDTCGGSGLWVDEDGDGVCDNFVDVDGDGVCDNRTGQGKGYGQQGGLWVDEDGDGVCDNAPANGTGNQYRGKGNNAGGGRRGGRS